MMRRCMESGNCQFGMVFMPESTYGTMLRINSFSQLPDGRSTLETVGERTFRILEWGSKDGYAVADVEFLPTATTSPEEAAQAAVWGDQLRRECLRVLRERGPRYQQAVEAQIGAMP